MLDTTEITDNELKGANILDSLGGIWSVVGGHREDKIRLRRINSSPPHPEILIRVVCGDIVDAETGIALPEFQ